MIHHDHTMTHAIHHQRSIPDSSFYRDLSRLPQADGHVLVMGFRVGKQPDEISRQQV